MKLLTNNIANIKNVGVDIKNSTTNKGSVVGTVGIALLTVADPLIKGETLSWTQYLGYSLLFIGVILYSVGNRRAKGKIIDSLNRIERSESERSESDRVDREEKRLDRD